MVADLSLINADSSGMDQERMWKVPAELTSLFHILAEF
jgi:hypothetical protein